jgi:SAM-dependent methyltransferase
MTIESGAQRGNLEIYDSMEVARFYAALQHITPCERLLFQSYLKPNSAVLDLGVGGGRTTPYLCRTASRYLGVDYAPEMVKACQAKFPALDFRVAEASDLEFISPGSFDAVVAAFNVIDYVIPIEKRLRCWQECHRVLRPGGVLIFSSHNPRAVIVRPSWNRERVRFLSKTLARGRTSERLAFLGLNCAAACLSVGRAALKTIGRALFHMSKAAFWRGEGHLLDPAHGGLLTHCWVPRKVIAEVEPFHFKLAKVLGDDYPSQSRQLITDWYYYVFVKTES